MEAEVYPEGAPLPGEELPVEVAPVVGYSIEFEELLLVRESMVEERAEVHAFAIVGEGGCGREAGEPSGFVGGLQGFEGAAYAGVGDAGEVHGVQVVCARCGGSLELLAFQQRLCQLDHGAERTIGVRCLVHRASDEQVCGGRMEGAPNGR